MAGLSCEETPLGLDRLALVLCFFDGAVAAQKAGQILREGGPRHHSIATGFDCLALQLALDVREEADDRSPALELGLDLRDQSEGLGVRVVQVEEDEGGAIFLAGLGQLGDDVLLRLEEGDLDTQLLRDFLNLGQDEEVFDEAVDPGGGIFAHGHRLDVVGLRVEAAVRHSAEVAILRVGDGIGDVAVGAAAIAVVHGTDEDLLTATLVLAASAGAVSVSVAGHRARAAVVAALFAGTLLEEALARLLFLPLMVGGWCLRGGSVGRPGTGGGTILRRSAVLLAFCLAAFVAPAASAAMSLPGMLPLWVLTLWGAILGLRR